MTAWTERTITDDYMPVILHDDGTREIIPGPALATHTTAMKFAQIEINDRNR